MVVSILCDRAASRLLLLIFVWLAAAWLAEWLAAFVA